MIFSSQSFAAASMLGLVACAAEPVASPAAGSLDTSSSTTPSSWPAECNGTTPFDTEACGVAMQRACREATDEASCTARDLGGDHNLRIRCAWARVVRFADVASCRVEAVEHRCEAGLEVGDVPIEDPCGPQAGGLYGSFEALSEHAELVYVPGLGGPIGKGTARVNQQTDTREAHSCGADSPPPPAALCACSEAACAAR